MSEVRLIDANELKECIVENIRQSGDQCSPVMLTMFGLFSDIIDNAPTVPLPEFKDGYKQAIIDGKTNFQRPQGEWLHKEFDPFLKENGQCSNCLQRERVGNFCRNCGADMRKGGAE